MSAMGATATIPPPARSPERPGLAASRVLATRSTSLAPRIVVLGGGFGGVAAALALARRCAGFLPVRVTLVSDRNYFLFTPMLAEAATGAVETRHVLHPLRPLCTATGVEFAEMTVEGIDVARRRVSVRHQRSAVRQELHYDRLVIALGAAPNTAIAPGAAEHALTFKGAGDAIQIRNRVIDLFEAAALTDDPWVRQKLLTFVVVGAGHAGTELMAALEELTRGILLRHYPTIPPDAVRLILVGSGILPQTARNLAAWAKGELERRGIAIETARAARVTEGGLELADGRVALDVVAGHHERWDGGGYPSGLREDAIPLTARIFAVADALDAMTHDRPHRKARPLGEALEALREGGGKQFDPKVAEAALAIPAARWAELLGVPA